MRSSNWSASPARTAGSTAPPRSSPAQPRRRSAPRRSPSCRLGGGFIQRAAPSRGQRVASAPRGDEACTGLTRRVVTPRRSGQPLVAVLTRRRSCERRRCVDASATTSSAACGAQRLLARRAVDVGAAHLEPSRKRRTSRGTCAVSATVRGALRRHPPALLRADAARRTPQRRGCARVRARRGCSRLHHRVVQRRAAGDDCPSGDDTPV